MEGLTFHPSGSIPHISDLTADSSAPTSDLRFHTLDVTSLTSQLSPRLLLRYHIPHPISYTHTHPTFHTSHLIAQTSLFTPFASPLKLHTSFFTPHNPHFTHPSSHLSSHLASSTSVHVSVTSDDEHMVIQYARVYISSSCEFEYPCFKNT